jgi:hypothetical protein
VSWFRCVRAVESHGPLIRISYLAILGGGIPGRIAWIVEEAMKHDRSTKDHADSLPFLPRIRLIRRKQEQQGLDLAEALLLLFVVSANQFSELSSSDSSSTGAGR